MGWPEVRLWFSALGGQSNQHTDRLRQDPELVEFTKAQDVIPDPAGELVTRPGFGKVRATAITNAPAFTFMKWMGSINDSLIIGANDSGGKLYQDSANPPVVIAGGTDFSSGDDVLLRGDLANEASLIIVSNDRGVPQNIDSSITRTDLGGTPPKGVDYKWWARRGHMFAPTVGATTFKNQMMYNDINDSPASWQNPTTKFFLNFPEEVLGGEEYQDHLFAFGNNRAWPIYRTPEADLPFKFQEDIIDEFGGGPSSIHSVVAAEGRLYWISKNFDVKCLRSVLGPPKSIGFPVQPFLRGLNSSRYNLIVGGWEPRYRMIVWAVSDGSDTTHQDVLALHTPTEQFFFHKMTRNAFANRVVSGELRLQGGGYAGLFYNEYNDDETTGTGDDSTTAIDADIQTPRHHLGLPGVLKKVPYVAVEFDPIGSEVVTVQYRFDDDSSFTSFDESTFTLSGTDIKTGYFRIRRPFDRIQLRFRDANSGERYRVIRYGFPNPMTTRTART